MGLAVQSWPNLASDLGIRHANSITAAGTAPARLPDQSAVTDRRQSGSCCWGRAFISIVCLNFGTSTVALLDTFTVAVTTRGSRPVASVATSRQANITAPHTT